MTWTTVPLAEIAIDIQSGFAQQPSQDGSGIPQLRTNNVSEDGSINLSSVKYVVPTDQQRKHYSLRPGDILFNNTNSVALVGKTALFDHEGEYLFSNHMTRVRLNEKLILPSFVAKYLFWCWRQGRHRSLVTQWVNQAAINQRQLAQIEIPIPPLSEQRRVVEVLDQTETLRIKRAEANAKARRILPALFVKMFGDPISNPKQWPLKLLGDLGKLDRGRSMSRPRTAPKLFGGPYPFVQTGEITKASGILTAFNTTYSELGLRQSKLWPKDTLCITIAAHIGETAILGFDACFPDSVVGFVPNKGVHSEYVHGLFQFFGPILEKQAPQLAQRNINLHILRNLEVPAPPAEHQQAFASHARTVWDLIASLNHAKETQETLSRTLMSRAFTGELSADRPSYRRDELSRELEESRSTIESSLNSSSLSRLKGSASC